jgi:predicted dehydrogenase
LDSFPDQLSEDYAPHGYAPHNGAGHDPVDATRLDALNQPICETVDHGAAPRASGPLRFGVIGYGYWGPQLARNLARLPMGRVTHIADRAPERRWEAHREHPSSCVTTSIDEVLASDVEALVIATPILTHYPLARVALEHGKHVLVEKPLADSVAHAEDLAALARERGLVLMVGHTYMYSPAVEELRRLVQSGALGRVYYVDSIRANLGIFQKDVNVVWDLAPHDISILNYIFGATPLRVSAHGGAYVQREVIDVAQLTLHYPNGMLAFLHVSWLSPSKIRRFTLVGDRQMVVYDDVETIDKIRVYNRGIDVPDHTSTFGEFQLSYRYGDIVSPFLNWHEPLGVECERFAEAILRGGVPRSDANDGLRVVRVLEAADSSMGSAGACIDIPQPGFHEHHSVAAPASLQPVTAQPLRAKADR